MTMITQFNVRTGDVQNLSIGLSIHLHRPSPICIHTCVHQIPLDHEALVPSYLLISSLFMSLMPLLQHPLDIIKWYCNNINTNYYYYYFIIFLLFSYSQKRNEGWLKSNLFPLTKKLPTHTQESKILTCLYVKVSPSICTNVRMSL